MSEKKFQTMTDISSSSSLGGGDGGHSEEILEVKRDLEGWREVLIPLSSVLRWEQPYFPAIIVGTTTFLFAIVWYTEMSALTTISLACMLVGIADFLVPFLGPSITGNKPWTGDEESQFTAICEKLCGIQHDILDCWRGLVIMRQHNSKLFFMVIMGILSTTAWIGNLVDNLFLSYIIVTFLFLVPGLQHNQVATKYLQPVVKLINQLKAGKGKYKAS